MSGPAALLTAVVFLPLLGAVVLALLPARSPTPLKAAAIGITLADFAAAIALWWGFDPATSSMQATAVLSWVPELGIAYRIGVDGISLPLVLLTSFLMPLTLIGAWKTTSERPKAFLLSMLLLETGMLGAFVALDLFLFYVFWEAMLIPMYFLIGVWGGQRRVYAALKFFVFTMAGSLVMLVAIIYVANLPGGGWDFSLSQATRRVFDPAEEGWLFWAFALAFAIKVPMFPVHTWLPDAHVEAPTPGSVILAGVLLKLGVYGFVRFAFPMFPTAAVDALPILGALGVVGIIYGALVAWVQPDMKKLVAYSSISHLGFCMLGLAALTHEGVSGALFIMIAHGVSTPALFLLVGVLYEQRHTRKLADYGGIASRMPIFAFLLVTAALASAGLPALSGFPGEFLVLLGTFTAGSDQQLWAVIAAAGVILAAVYLLWMVQKVLFGPLQNPANENLRDVDARELGVVGTLLAFSLVIGLYPGLILDPARPALDRWIQVVHQQGTGQPYRPDRGIYRSAVNTLPSQRLDGPAPVVPHQGDHE